MLLVVISSGEYLRWESALAWVVVGQWGPPVLTCMSANEVAFGFRCTRRTSLLELTTTRLAEGLGADGSLALEVLVTIVRDEIERSNNLPANMVCSKHHTESWLYGSRVSSLAPSIRFYHFHRVSCTLMRHASVTLHRSFIFARPI